MPSRTDGLDCRLLINQRRVGGNGGQSGREGETEGGGREETVACVYCVRFPCPSQSENVYESSILLRVQ